ncbi:hypothetical protein Tco_0654766 [Tanacetum coccineum]|uniref:Uncharacterized protein n=1 Tax=Tanacetum coccineum TaxID=301880 RepID=A0ABQ4X4E8_9ASTR
MACLAVDYLLVIPKRVLNAVEMPIMHHPYHCGDQSFPICFQRVSQGIRFIDPVGVFHLDVLLRCFIPRGDVACSLTGITTSNQSMCTFLIEDLDIEFLERQPKVPSRSSCSSIVLHSSFCWRSVWIFEAVVEGATEDGEVVHEYFHAILDQFIEYGCHTVLESCWRIGIIEWHSVLYAECAIWAGEMWFSPYL